MSEEIKNQVTGAWNRYILEHQKRYKKNEGSASQHEDYCRLFKEGIANHPRLSKKEKLALFQETGLLPPAMQDQ